MALAGALSGSGCARVPSVEGRLATSTCLAMGGEVRVVVRCPSLEAHGSCLEMASRACAEVQRLEALATDWRPEGEIARVNAAAGQGPQPISGEVEAMLRTSLRVAEVTDGAFDPTIGALWGLWDFEAGRVPSAEQVAARLPLVSWRGLTLAPGQAALAQEGMALTLGGVGQGHAASQALALIPPDWEALVDVSGDVAVRGRWTLDVRDPRGEPGDVIASVTIEDAVLSTAGDYARAFEKDGRRYHHILDPRSGWPAEGAWSATVVHREGGVADALDTALIVLGRDASAVDALGAWALVVDARGVVELGSRAAGVRAVHLKRQEGR